MDTQKTENIQVTKTPAKRSKKRDYTYAVGRQREAVARVRLYAQIREGAKWGEHALSKEQILVNEMPIEKYFSGEVAKKAYMQPFLLTNTFGKYAVTVKVAGGGQNGQLDAFVMGVARALASIDIKKLRQPLKKAGLLMRDARVRERRKVGTGGKARRKKQSPKR